MKKANEIRDAIDRKKEKEAGKKKKNHLTRVTGSRGPIEFVVFTDGTEVPYTKEEEEELINAMIDEYGRTN